MTHDCLRGVFFLMNSQGWEHFFWYCYNARFYTGQTSEKESFPVLFGHR